MSFDAAIAKPGSQWLTADGRAFTFRAFIPQAREPRAIFTSEDGMVHSRRSNGRQYEQATSSHDITTPIAEGKCFRIGDRWLVTDVSGKAKITLFAIKERAIRAAESLNERFPEHAPYFITRLPGFSMNTGLAVVEIDMMALGSAPVRERFAENIGDALTPDNLNWVDVKVGEIVLPSEIDRAIEAYGEARSAVDRRPDQGTRRSGALRLHDSRLAELRKVIAERLKTNPTHAKTNLAEAKCQATEHK